VQRCAMMVWEGLGGFKETLLDDEEVMHYLSVKDVNACFDVKPYLAHVDYIFKRTFSKKG